MSKGKKTESDYKPKLGFEHKNEEINLALFKPEFQHLNQKTDAINFVIVHVL